MQLFVKLASPIVIRIKLILLIDFPTIELLLSQQSSKYKVQLKFSISFIIKSFSYILSLFIQSIFNEAQIYQYQNCLIFLNELKTVFLCLNRFDILYQSNLKMETQNKQISHFFIGIDLPENSILEKYVPEKHNKNKKNKQKYDKFSYYKTSEGKIIKILYRDEQNYVELGEYPFTNPKFEVKTLDHLNSLNPQRVFVTEAAYIGHQEKKLVIKKMKGIELGVGQIEIDTGDDNFELIEIKNQERFNQFLKVMENNPRANQMSIRIFIREAEGQQPEVLDYEFFFREQQIKASKNFKRN